MIFRDNFHSLSIGAISEESYTRGEKRSLISLQMCFMASMVEMFAIATAILSGILGAQLQELSVPNIHFPDAIFMSVIIPSIHLLNQEETKGIIFEKGWYQGFKHVFGRYTEAEGENRLENGSSNTEDNDNLNMDRRKSLSGDPNLQISKRQLWLNRCNSSTDMVLQHDVTIKDKKTNPKRRHSIENFSPKPLVPDKRKSASSDASTSIKIPISNQNSNINCKKMSRKSSSSSISTLYLDE